MIRKGIIIAIVFVIAIVAGLYALGLSVGNKDTSMNNDSPSTATNGAGPAQQSEDRIAALLGNDPNRINNPGWRQTAQDIIRTETMDNALLVINSDTSWSAVVQGSDFVQESVDGTGSRSIEVRCDSGGIFSHVVQKGTEDGALNVYMAKDGHIIKQGSTSADYGVVSVAGTC